MGRLLFLSLSLLGLAVPAPSQPPFPTGEPPPSFASVDSFLVFHPTYLQASASILFDGPPDPDSVEVLIVGMVTGFRSPIEDLPTHEPGVEMTFAVSNLDYVAWWLWDSLDGQYGGVSYEFAAGLFRMYVDDTPDADLADPLTFEDGELVLEGVMESYLTGIRDCYFCPAHNDGLVVFTGGSLFPSVSRDGHGFHSVLRQLQEPATDPALSLGYQTSGDGVLTLFIPTPASPTTWGQLKARYGK